MTGFKEELFGKANIFHIYKKSKF